MLHTRRHPELNNTLANTLIKDIEPIFEQGKTLSVGVKQVVKHCIVQGNLYILKRYHSNGPLPAIRHLLGTSRSDNSYRFANYLEKHQVSCPQHILIIKQISLVKSTSYLVMEKAPGTPLFDFIQAGSTLELSNLAIRNIAKLITKMQWLGITHGDLHTRNFIVAEDDTIQIIDLDSCKTSKSKREKDIDRFTNAIKKGARYNASILLELERASNDPIDLSPL